MATEKELRESFVEGWNAGFREECEAEAWDKSKTRRTLLTLDAHRANDKEVCHKELVDDLAVWCHSSGNGKTISTASDLILRCYQLLSSDRFALQKQSSGGSDAVELDFTTLLAEAQKQVATSVLFKKFISGTPLENDIAVWMVEFSLRNRREK